MTVSVDFFSLPCSLSAHYPLWPLLTMMSQQEETTTEQWREERVWDTVCPGAGPGCWNSLLQEMGTPRLEAKCQAQLFLSPDGI